MVPASDLATDLASLSPVPLAEKDAGQACRGTAVGGRSRLYPVVLLSRALAADELPEREPTRFSERCRFFIQQGFIVHSACARNCFSSWVYRRKQCKDPCLLRAYPLVRRQRRNEMR